MVNITLVSAAVILVFGIYANAAVRLNRPRLHHSSQGNVTCNLDPIALFGCVESMQDEFDKCIDVSSIFVNYYFKMTQNYIVKATDDGPVETMFR